MGSRLHVVEHEMVGMTNALEYTSSVTSKYLLKKKYVMTVVIAEGHSLGRKMLLVVYICSSINAKEKQQLL